jgi:DnaJ-domain-containing protein 1
MRDPCTFRLERVSCGKLACSRCEGTKPAHGPYWYAYWETGGRARARMQKRYIGKAPATATPEELRALFELRQQRRAEAEERKRRRDTRSDTNDSRTGSSSGTSGSGTGGSGGTSGGSTSGGSSYRGRDGRSYSSDRNKSDPFSSRRPPPIEEDFEVIGSKRGASFEQARQAYKDAARKHHPDAGGDPEVMKRVNAAWDRVRRTYGR